MAVYSVSYDLRLPGQDYSSLIAELESSPDWWHYLQSTWLISTEETAEQLSNRLSPHIDQNDSMLVIEVTDDYSGWLLEEAWQWIREHVSGLSRGGALAAHLRTRR